MKRKAALAAECCQRAPGLRRGTRSHGSAAVFSWQHEVEEPASAPNAAVSVITVMLIAPNGRVGLRLSLMRDTTATKPKKPTSRATAQLRDYLTMGDHDPAANATCTSVSVEETVVRQAQRDIQWGCKCKGIVAKGGEELRCRICWLYFHAKCERIDCSPDEMKKMKKEDSFACGSCSQLEREMEGHGASAGRYIWQCRTCTRTFEEDDNKAADKHGVRCAAQIGKRQWSCRCNGSLVRAKLMATQCSDCSKWFHSSCKAQERNWWDSTARRDVCAACESGAETPVKSTGRGGTSKTAKTAWSVACASGLTPLTTNAVDDQDDLERGGNVASDASRIAPQQPKLKEVGTLADKRVYVKPSGLGAVAGLGLFAAQVIQQGQIVSTYFGSLLFREQLAPDADTSYVLRIPNSGGALFDGKPYADAIRANPNNPAEDGNYYPVNGAPEWHVGAASMANDPRDRRLNNAHLTYVKPEGGSRAVRELAYMRPVLVATHDIQPDEVCTNSPPPLATEPSCLASTPVLPPRPPDLALTHLTSPRLLLQQEILYSYGSSKPFEHERKEQLEAMQHSRKRGRDVCRFVWVPHENAW